MIPDLRNRLFRHMIPLLSAKYLPKIWININGPKVIFEDNLWSVQELVVASSETRINQLLDADVEHAQVVVVKVSVSMVQQLNFVQHPLLPWPYKKIWKRCEDAKRKLNRNISLGILNYKISFLFQSCQYIWMKTVHRVKLLNLKQNLSCSVLCRTCQLNDPKFRNR